MAFPLGGGWDLSVECELHTYSRLGEGAWSRFPTFPLQSEGSSWRAPDGLRGHMLLTGTWGCLSLFLPQLLLANSSEMFCTLQVWVRTR